MSIAANIAERRIFIGQSRDIGVPGHIPDRRSIEGQCGNLGRVFGIHGTAPIRTVRQADGNGTDVIGNDVAFQRLFGCREFKVDRRLSLPSPKRSSGNFNKVLIIRSIQ